MENKIRNTMQTGAPRIRVKTMDSRGHLSPPSYVGPLPYGTLPCVQCPKIPRMGQSTSLDIPRPNRPLGGDETPPNSPLLKMERMHLPLVRMSGDNHLGDDNQPPTLRSWEKMQDDSGPGRTGSFAGLKSWPMEYVDPVPTPRVTST